MDEQQTNAAIQILEIQSTTLEPIVRGLEIEGGRLRSISNLSPPAVNSGFMVLGVQGRYSFGAPGRTTGVLPRPPVGARPQKVRFGRPNTRLVCRGPLGRERIRPLTRPGLHVGGVGRLARPARQLGGRKGKDIGETAASATLQRVVFRREGRPTAQASGLFHPFSVFHTGSEGRAPVFMNSCCWLRGFRGLLF